MRCQKCGYNSFEYNEVCPKCQKSLSAMRTALKISMPEPHHFNFFQAADQNFDTDHEENSFDGNYQADEAMDVDIDVDMDINVDDENQQQFPGGEPTLTDLLDDVNFTKK